MSQRVAKILLASVILARSSSYVLQKIGLTDMDVFNMMGIRFLLAFFIMLVIFHKRLLSANRSSVIAGLFVGTIFFIVMSLEVFSLKTCASSTTAFLENTAVVMVPLAQAIITRKAPRFKMILGFSMAMIGVAFMTLQGSSFLFTIGHLLALGAAITYAAAILVTDYCSKKVDPFIIGMTQLGTMGGLSIVFSFIFETPHLPSAANAWLAILLLVIVCSCFGFTLQPVAQKYTSAETAGLYCAFGPLGAGILGWIFLKEVLSPFAILGAVLILISIVLVQKKDQPPNGS